MSLRSMRILPSRRTLLTVPLLPALACGGSDAPTQPPPTGSIEVSVATTGSDPDDDGYRIHLGELKSSHVAINGSVVFEQVAPGDYDLTLSEAAANCSSPDGPVRSVSVVAGQLTSVSLDVECPPLSVLHVVVNTLGDEPDPDGYAINLDGTEVAAAEPNASLDIEGLHSGRQRVTITGIAENCTAVPPTEASSDVLLEPGGTADVSFTLFCLAPDAGRLTFVHTESTLRIAAMAPTGGKADILSNRGGFAPAVSLDGQLVAFSSSDDIFVMNWDGSNPRNLTNTSTRLETAPAWSPDGTRIAYMAPTSTTNEFFDIFVRNVDGTGEVKITNAPEFGGWDPAWSPDGSRIVVRTYTDDWGGGNLWLMDPSGGNRTQLTTQGSHDAEAEWSPDGTRIVFGRQVGPDNDFDVFVINADGTGLTRLTDDGGTPSNAPSWSPDGRWIAFASRRWHGSPKFQIHVMRSDGSDVVRLTSTGADQPFWAPQP